MLGSIQVGKRMLLASMLAGAIASASPCQADRFEGLRLAVEVAAGARFLKAPEVVSVSAVEMLARLARRDRADIGDGDVELDLFCGRYSMSRAHCMPIWVDPGSLEIVVCMEGLRGALDPGVAPNVEKALVAFGFALALNDFMHNNSVRLSWLKSAKEIDDFNAIRWGNSWTIAKAVFGKEGLEEARSSLEAIFDGYRQDSDRATDRKACTPFLGYFSKRLSEGCQACREYAVEPPSVDATNISYWRTLHACYPYIGAESPRDKQTLLARIKAESGSRKTLESHEWCLFLFDLKIKALFPGKPIRISRERLPDAVEDPAFLGARSEIFRSTGYRLSSGFFKASIFAAKEGENENEIHRRLVSDWRRVLRLYSGAKAAPEGLKEDKVRGTVWSGVRGTVWSGVLITCGVREAKAKSPFAYFVAKSRSTILTLVFVGHETIREEIRGLCAVMLRAAMRGPYNFGHCLVTFDQLRILLGYDTSNLYLGEQALEGLVEAFLRLRGFDLDELRNKYKKSVGVSHVSYSSRDPIPGGYFSVDVDSERETIRLDGAH